MADEDRSQGLLIADGDALARHSLAEYLRHCGYQVVEAATYEEAMSLLADPRWQERIDAVLSDVELPGEGNGFTLRKWLADNLPDVTVILAGNVAAAAQAAGDLCEQGPDLKRPYDPKLVLDRIRRMQASRN